MYLIYDKRKNLIVLRYKLLINLLTTLSVLDNVSDVILDKPQLARVTWLINDFSIHGNDVLLCERALLCRCRYCRTNSFDRSFISITLLECNSVYAPSISRRINLFSHRDNITHSNNDLARLLQTTLCKEFNWDLLFLCYIGINIL